MRRFLTLVCLLFLALPAGITISGCYRNPAGNYCNGAGYGLKVTDVYAITLQPQTTGISMAYGQTRQVTAPSAVTCKNASASVTSYTYGTSNNKLVDISPSGSICAGTWNRNSGGGIADYTICNYPTGSLGTTNNLPYAVAYITASANAVTSNSVAVYVHTQVSSISLVGPQQCLSQTQVAQLDAEACYSSGGTQYELCAPTSVATSGKYACPGGLADGVQAASLPVCSAAIGTLSYTAGTSSVASINATTNEITAELPGTTVITASVAGSGSAAGYFSTCPPRAISLSLNGKTSGTVTQGVTQTLVTTVYDTNTAPTPAGCGTDGCPITGLTLDYQSTNPLDISVGSAGAITASYPGTASVYAICQPGTCNPAPINKVGVYGTGLSVSSNAVNITTPGTASSYVWYASPGQSQYFVPVELLTGTVGSTVRLPYVPNSMVMDRTGTNLYFGSSHELMTFSTTSNSLSKADTSVPGVVLAASPNNSQLLINDPARSVFYLYNVTGTIAATFGGLGVSAQWTPDSKTLYVTDSAAANSLPANIAAGITGHTDTLYVYNANTGWTTYPCSAASPCALSSNPNSIAVMVPSVGAYLGGYPTVAHTWCPTGTVGNYDSMVFYPQLESVAGDTVNVQTDAVAATTDGDHILGAAKSGTGIMLTDINVTVPSDNCLPATYSSTTPAAGSALQPLLLSSSTPAQSQVAVDATSVNAVVTSPAAVTTGTNASSSSLSFITYNYTGSSTPSTPATLPYYTQVAGPSSSFGQLGYITFGGSSASSITAPVAGAFSPDNTQFFVSTSGDNLVHYIDTTTLTDKQQINVKLPACAVGSDPGCMFDNSTNPVPTSGIVPATAIAVKPRSTT